jgi:hypothetical protein
MTKINSTKQSLSATCTALITGINALANADTVTSGATTYTKGQLLAPLIAYLPLPAATANAKTAYSNAVATEATARTAAVTVIEEVIKPYLYLRLGKSSPALVTYGLDPVKTPQKSAATKAAAVQKSQATRKALGTKGPDQKKAAKKALAATPAAAPVTKS